MSRIPNTEFNETAPCSELEARCGILEREKAVLEQSSYRTLADYKVE
jgi:hypothetical protein